MSCGEDTDGAASMFDEDVEPCADGGHKWMCLTMQWGDIVGADSEGNPVFVPDAESTDMGHLDRPWSGSTAYGCSKCSCRWSPELTAEPS